MRFLPFGKSETRAGDSLTDAVLAGLVANAQGNTTARASALGVVEAAAGLWGRAFASAAVTPSSMATSALTPAVLERIGRGLLLRGEALFEIVVEDGGLTLLEAVAWDVTGGRGDWMYRADFSVPSGSISRVIPADRVLNPRIGATPARSWRGQSPLPTLTTTLAGILESKLIEEIKGPSRLGCSCSAYWESRGSAGGHRGAERPHGPR